MKNSVDSTMSKAELDSRSPLWGSLDWLKRRATLARTKTRSNTPPVKKKLLFEAMEQRVLLAADPLTSFVVAQVHGSLDAPGETDRFTFTLAADMQVVFDSLTNNANFNWSLVGPRGTLVNSRSFAASDSVDLVGTSPVLKLVAGSYTLTVDGVADATGAYDFQLLDLAKANALTPGTPVSNSLTPANETSVYKFDAIAGEHYFLDVTGRTGGDIAWQLLDPSDHQVFAPTAMNSASQDVDLASLSSSGTYTLLVEGRIGATGTANYAFNLQHILPTTVPLARRAAAAVSIAAPAPTVSWIGASGGAWSTASNWSNGVVPTATDDVYIGLAAGQAVTCLLYTSPSPRD